MHPPRWLPRPPPAAHSASRRAEAWVTRINCTACNEPFLRAACATPSGISPPSACCGDGDQALHQLTFGASDPVVGVRAMPLAANSLRRTPCPLLLRTPQRLAIIAREISRPSSGHSCVGFEQALWTVLSHRSTPFSLLHHSLLSVRTSDLPRVERMHKPFSTRGGVGGGGV